MKTFLKWTGIVLLALVVIILTSSWILARKFNKEFLNIYEITPVQVIIPTDSLSLERGRTLTVGCRACHGVDLAGEVFFDDPKIGTLASSNLTRAVGSETEGYSDQDFVRAMRHGLNKRGNPLMVMPSESYTHFSDADLGSIIAYLKSLPPVDRKFPKRQFTYMSQVMAGAGMFGNLFSYKVIDHEKAKHITAPPVGNSVEYGEYVVKFDGCKVCHKADLGGGKSADPVSPPAPDISSGSPSGKWTVEQFINTFRTGKTPDGRALDGEFMPFSGLGALSDVEIEAVYNYIHSLPPAARKE
jgi:mono/diheme cytochrome c family protein